MERRYVRFERMVLRRAVCDVVYLSERSFAVKSYGEEGWEEDEEDDGV